MPSLRVSPRHGSRFAQPLLALAALVWLLLAAAPALAVDPPALDGAITDRSGVITNETEIRDAQARLYNQTGTQLYVLFLPTTDGEDINDFIGRVADRNADLFTTKDALLVIATDDRRMSIVTGEELNATVDQNELDKVRTDDIRPRLANNDWSGGAAAAALGLLDAIKGSTTSGSGGGGGGSLNIILVIGGIIAIGAIAFFIWGRLNASKANRAEAAAQEELGRKASSMLVATDDALRKVEQEIGFTEAQFGADEAKKLSEALAAAKAELTAAFKLSTDLDDETPETPEQRRTMLEQIITHCETANATVAAQQAQIDALRDLGKNAETVIPEIEARAAATDEKVEAGRATLAAFSAYAAESWAAVATNADTAAAKVAAARKSLTDAKTAVIGGKRDEAAKQARAAENALGEADALLTAIAETDRALKEMTARLAAAMAQEHADLAKAEQAVASGRAKGKESQLADAKARLVEAQQLASARPPDVANANRLVTEADALLDAVMEDVERAAASAQNAIANAATSIAQARALVNAGQGGRRALSRVTEAEGYLQRANELLSVDPMAATQAAQTADALADEAVAEARAQSGPVSYGTGTGGFGGPGYSGGGGGGGGLGDILTGIVLGNVLGGGNNRSGGWGGSGSGWGGGFGSGGFGGGSSRRSGGFGGGSRRSGGGLGGGRRSGGGMGGGRRSSGGF
jgi:plasmid stabilization system protein ParE